MSMTRSDLRTRIRDYLYETTADLWTDAQLNRWIDEEMRQMPRRGVYLEQWWTTTSVANQVDYSLPTGTIEVEGVDINMGSASIPQWVEVDGWDQFTGALVLQSPLSAGYTLRAHIRKTFAALTDDVTATEVPDEKTEIVVAGVAIRAYKAIIGYLLDSKNWDSITKPDGVSMNQVTNYLRDAKSDYKDLIQIYRTYPKPRSIDLVG